MLTADHMTVLTDVLNISLESGTYPAKLKMSKVMMNMMLINIDQYLCCPTLTEFLKKVFIIE